MSIRTHSPPQPLSNFVELLWYYEGSVQSHTKERLLPTGTMELVIHLANDTHQVYHTENDGRSESFHGGVVCGAHSRSFLIDAPQQGPIVGVHFKPGGAFPFFKLPMDELHNIHVSLETLWGAAAGSLREQLLGRGPVEHKFRVLVEALWSQALSGTESHPAVAYALKAFRQIPDAQTIADVSHEIGLSQRRFIDLFTKEVGLTPKLFCRVRRFQEVLRAIQQSARVEWVDVALACGYFDQAHFIHDFRAFSGINPTAYLKDQGEHLNHVPIRE